jgi:hypothetical protein
MSLARLSALKAEWAENNASFVEIDRSLRPFWAQQGELKAAIGKTYPHTVDGFGKVSVTGYSSAGPRRIELRDMLDALNFESREMRAERDEHKRLDSYYRHAVEDVEAAIEAASKRKANQTKKEESYAD